jgi:molybdopterin molybdotransferase
MVLPFEEARARVLAEVTARRKAPLEERVELALAHGRVLAEPALADRDQPPFDRSTRDGFAVRASDVMAASADGPVELEVVAEIAAGQAWAGTVRAGQAVEIMTGAPVPTGADAVVMVEHTESQGSGVGRKVRVKRAATSWENIVARGAEAKAGGEVLAPGRIVGAPAIGLLASLGYVTVRVTRRPRVVVIATGDELVPIEHAPGDHQIRDSNRWALTSAVREAGAEPLPMPLVRDDPAATEAALATGASAADALVITGGVSAGKHDHVEAVLAKLGAEVVFDGVQIRPGRPVVFGFVRGKPFFGLPGNPVSSLVTFELFARPALALLAGASAAPTRLVEGTLAEPFRQRGVPLTVFQPAQRTADGGWRALTSQGSGDLVSLASADGWIVAPPETAELPTGSRVRVVPMW